jgi:hypothetical protein
LEVYKDSIGIDFLKYKNHVFRVFYNSLLMDKNPLNEEKYAIAAVFHDIGIWTDHTIDYLDPSINRAKIFLTKTGKEEWIEEISLMINWHHKPRGYIGNHQETVENFRKADWIDVTLGLRKFGLGRKPLKSIRNKFPNLGFHAFLLRKLTRNFFMHPLRPLPMFKF